MQLVSDLLLLSSQGEWFGWINHKSRQPTHVNTKDDPMPVVTTNDFRKRRSCGPKLVGQHLSATKANMHAIFHLSRPDAKVVLLAADFDADEHASRPDLVDELVVEFNQKLGLRAFCEPSRNRRGRYAWIKVLVEEPIEEFNRKLNRLNRRLRKLIGTKHEHEGVGFDAVKGTIQYDEPNPLFDPQWARQFSELLADELDEHNFAPAPPYLRTNEKIYKWHKSHYRRGEFQRQEELERFVHHYGTLVTAPLCGVRNDGEAGEDRWIEFWLWEMDEGNVIRSSELWAIFGIDDQDDVDEVTVRPPPQAEIDDVTIDSPSIALHTNGSSWKMLTNKDCKLQSANGAAAIALAMIGGPQPPERHDDLRRLTHSLYVQYGAATEEPTPERYARLDEALNYFITSGTPANEPSPG